MKVKIKLIENGVLPQYQREGDACLDCYSAETLVLKKGERRAVKLGFALQLPNGYEAVVRGRSGLSKKGIDVCIGTVDQNYRGEIMANCVNNSGEDFKIEFGNRICQLAIRRTEDVEFEQCEELDDTVRGTNGFGSSGL